MTLLSFFVAIGAVALVLAAYFLSIRRLFELPLDGIELHPFYTADGWRILLYRHRRGSSNGEPVLLVHGYSSNHWNLTAPRDESLADYLAEAGFDCWAIDLRGTRSSHAPPGTPRHRATFDGYVMQDLPGAIDYIGSVTGHDQVHWVGHSLGGTLLYAYELVHGGTRVASGTTIASPPGLRPGWPAWQSHLIRVMEYAPAPFAAIQRGLAPIHAIVKPRTRMVPVDWDNLSPKFGVAEFFSAVETPAGPVTRTLEECAKHRYLAVDNDRVNVLAGLNRLEIPLFVIGCPLDPIVPVPALREFFDRLPRSDKRFMELSRAQGCERDYDHIDPPFARQAATEVFAPITEWIKAHSLRHVQLPEPAISSAPIRERDTVQPRAYEASAATTAAPFNREPNRVGREATLPDSPPLWDRALEDAAHMLDGLNTESAVHSDESAAAKVRSKRRGKTIAAKRKITSKNRTTTASKRTASTRSKSKREKPEKMRAGRNNEGRQHLSGDWDDAADGIAAIEPRAQDRKSRKSKSRKKDKKKRDKSKEKSRKKKSKGKKSP